MFNIHAYPSLLYGDPLNMDEYEGRRIYEDLAEFAKEILVPYCSVRNIDLCDDETKTRIQKYESMSVKELGSLIDAEEDKLKAAKVEYENELERLQVLHDRAADAKSKAVEAVKLGGMPMMKAIHELKRKANKVPASGDEL